jgi:hypothetical protein
LPAAQLKYGQVLADILTEFHEDFGWDYLEDLAVVDFPPLYQQGYHRDDFGTVWHSDVLGLCGIPVEWPIPDLSRYHEYRWPGDFTAGPPKGRQYSGHMLGHDDRWWRGAGSRTSSNCSNCMACKIFAARGPAARLEHLWDDLLAFNLR